MSTVSTLDVAKLLKEYMEGVPLGHHVNMDMLDDVLMEQIEPLTDIEVERVIDSIGRDKVLQRFYCYDPLLNLDSVPNYDPQDVYRQIWLDSIQSVLVPISDKVLLAPMLVDHDSLRMRRELAYEYTVLVNQLLDNDMDASKLTEVPVNEELERADWNEMNEHRVNARAGAPEIHADMDEKHDWLPKGWRTRSPFRFGNIR